MTKNSMEIVVLDSDESGSDVEEVSPSMQRHLAHSSDDNVVDLVSSTANHHNSRRRRRRNTDAEVEFVGSTSAKQPYTASAAASASPDIQFVGTKRPRPTIHNDSQRSSIPSQMNNFNNGYSIMNNPMSNTGGFMDRLSSMLGFGRGAGMNVLNRGNFGGMGWDSISLLI